VGEVVADAAKAVVEFGRSVDRNGDDQAGAERGAELGSDFFDTPGRDPVGGEMNEEKIGRGGGEGFDDFDEVGAVGGFAAGEVDPVEERIRGGDRADFVEGARRRGRRGCPWLSRCRSKRSASGSVW